MTQGPILVMNLACFAFLYFTTKKAFDNSANSLSDAIGMKERMKALNEKHMASAVAIIMLLLIQLNFKPFVGEYFNIHFDQLPVELYLLPGLTLILSVVIPIKESGRSTLPVLIGYYLLRTLYLILYEVYFRLTLPFSVSFYTGIIPAMLISTLLYGWIHRFSPRLEYYTSFLFGLILYWLVYQSGSIYPAIIMHLLLSLPYELRIILPHKTSRS